LIDILFYNDYFNYLENAEKYVVALKNEIENYIDVKKQYDSPKAFLKYGNFYSVVSLNNELLGTFSLIKKDIAI